VEFRWNDWNSRHVAEHGVDPEEAERVVEDVEPPWPRYGGDGKYMIWGRGRGERLLQVVFLLDPDDAVFVIHARPLTEREKRSYRRRRR
jgi:uncharacterized DUF497 family protein